MKRRLILIFILISLTIFVAVILYNKATIWYTEKKLSIIDKVFNEKDYTKLAEFYLDNKRLAISPLFLFSKYNIKETINGKIWILIHSLPIEGRKEILDFLSQKLQKTNSSREIHNIICLGKEILVEEILEFIKQKENTFSAADAMLRWFKLDYTIYDLKVADSVINFLKGIAEKSNFISDNSEEIFLILSMCKKIPIDIANKLKPFATTPRKKKIISQVINEKL